MEPAITFDNLQQFVQDGRVYICELSSNLSLYHYKECSESDSNDLKQCRGIVFDDKGTLIMRGFPYTPEHNPDDTHFDNKYETNFSQYRFFDSYEGTIIRVFYHINKWYVSTHKRFDASNSRWASTMSFEDLFRSAIDNVAKSSAESVYQDYDSFFNFLDHQKQYVFLITSTQENRIVCASNVKVPFVFHVGTFVDHHFTFEDRIPGINFPFERTFSSPSDLRAFVQNSNPMYIQGLVAISPKLGCFKMISNAYTFLYKLRGNQPNLKLRYLQLLKRDSVDTDEQYKMRLNSFISLYPTSWGTFKEIDRLLGKISANIHSAYIRRFVMKEFAVVPPSQYEILKKCHGEYLLTHTPVTPVKVYETMMKESAESLYRIISN